MSSAAKRSPPAVPECVSRDADRLAEVRGRELALDALDGLGALVATIAVDPGEHVRLGTGEDRGPVALDLTSEVGLGGAREEHAAVLGHHARAGDLAPPGAPADAVTRLEHDDAASRLHEVTRRRDPREPRPDHHHVDIHGEARYHPRSASSSA